MTKTMDDVEIHETAVFCGDFKVGAGVIINAGAVIGRNVTLALGAKVGIGAIINDDLYIGSNSVIGPGAVVLSNIPKNVVVQGNPAKCVGKVMPSNERKQITYAIPHDANWQYCKSPNCNAMIYWIETPAGKRMPVDTDGTPHFATCPDADKFRRRKTN